MDAAARIDAYIAGKADFARPILEHIRAMMARHAPDAEEAVKWGTPSWTYRGKLLAGMAAFKEHATFGFWRGGEVAGEAASREAMGQFGRLRTIADLPGEAALAAMIAKAKMLIDEGAPPPRQTKHPKPVLEMPGDLAAALAADPAAQAAYDGFSPSARRDYLEWVIEARRPETRARRIEQAVAQMAEGKTRHWKYQNC